MTRLVFRFLVTGLFLLTMPLGAWGQQKNTLTVGARPLGMGGAFTAVGGDANTMFWNPAGLPRLQRQEVTTMYGDVYGFGLNTFYLAYVLPITDNHAIGVDWTHLGNDDSHFGDVLGYRFERINLGYGYRVHPMLQVGATGKFLNTDTSLDNVSIGGASGFGFDAGVIFSPWQNLNLGVALHDIGGSSVTFDTDVSDQITPQLISAGVAFKPVDKLLLAADVDDRIHVGAEYWLFNALALRGGWQKELDAAKERSFGDTSIYSVGAGLRYRSLQFDYAYEIHPRLSGTHWFSFSLFINPAFVSIQGAALKPNPVFRSLYRHYDGQEFAEVVLKNSAPDPLPVTLALNVPTLTAGPYEETVVLPPQTTTTHTMKIAISDSVLLTEAAVFDNFIQPTLTVRYIRDNVEKETSQRLSTSYVMGRGKISWDVPERLAAFITANDASIGAFVSQIMQDYDEVLRDEFGHSNLGRAMLLFDAIGQYGIRYRPDPQTPFLKIADQENVFDTVRYPIELLTDKSGDCDDCTVLYAAMLENLNIETVLLDIFAPNAGHVTLMFDSGISPVAAQDYFLPADYVEWNGRVWIPVEVTLFGSDFNTAWRTAVQEYYQRKQEGYVNEVFLTTPRLTNFQPGRIETVSVTPPGRTRVDSLVTGDLVAYAAKIRKVVGTASANDAEGLYDLAAHYLRIGRLDDALEALNQTIQADPNLADAHNALGVVYSKKSQYEEALQAYNRALQLNPSDAGIRLNMAINYVLMGREDQAREEYQRAKQQDPQLEGVLDSLLRPEKPEKP